MESLEKYLDRYFQLELGEMEDLYDLVDEVYNVLGAKYIDALASPEENKELVGKLFTLARSLVSKTERSIEEELMLIAIMDIFANDLYFKLYGEEHRQTNMEETMEESSE